MSLKSLFLTALVFLGVIYWQRARDLKQYALQAASDYCTKLDLSLLDESVALKRIRLIKDRNGSFQFNRIYQFDFTVNGQDRYQGEIFLVGKKVLHVKLAPHRID